MANRIMQFSILFCLLLWLLSFAYADADRRTATTESVSRHWIDSLVEELRGKRAPRSVRDRAALSATWRRDAVEASLVVANKKALFQQLGTLAGRTSGLSAKEIVGAIGEREKIGSTGFGSGTAIPHGKIQGLDRVTGFFARLASPSAFNAFKATLDADPRLQVEAQTTLAYFQGQSAGVSKVLRIIGIVVGSIMAIGAVFGALNTMFATVASRAREIATLRAIGFRGVPVVVAVMLETMLLALLGGLIGGALAWLVFNGYTASTIAGGVGQLTFDFRVTGALLWSGLKWALAIGFVGGLFPALRAATLPVTTALRAL